MPSLSTTAEQIEALASLDLDWEPDHQPRKAQEKPWLPDLNPTQRLIFDDPTQFILAYGEKGCRVVDTMIYTDTGLKRLERMAPPNPVAGFNPIREVVMANKTTAAIADGYWVESDRSAITAILAHGGELTGSLRHPVWVCSQSPSGEHGFGWERLSAIKEKLAAGWRFWTPFFGHPNWQDNTSTVDVPMRRKTCKICGKKASARGLCFNHYQNLVNYHGLINEHPLTEAQKITLTRELAYAVGALTGDGSLNFGSDNRAVEFTNADSECIERVRLGLSEIGVSLSKTLNPIQFLALPAGNIKPFLASIGLVGLAHEKRIPDVIVEGGKSCAAAFLRGLFDTDGTVEEAGVVSFCTTSELLSRDVQDLLAAFGILCVRRPKKSASGNPTWTLSIMGRHAVKFGEQIGFQISRKQSRIKTPTAGLRNPHGFNSNRYGYPDPIKSVLRKVAKASRTGKRIRSGHPVKYVKRVGPRKTSWYLNRVFPWGYVFDVADSEQQANERSSELQKRLDKEKAMSVRTREWHDAHRNLHSFGSVPQRPKVDAFCAVYGCHAAVKEFLVSDHWLEIVEARDAEADLADLHVPGEHSFLAAGTLNHNSGKTLGAAHKLVRHCYENWDALGLVITPSIRTGKYGVVHDLESLVLPEWEKGIGLEWLPSRLDPSTKDRVLKLANRFGGWSTILQISIPYAEAIPGRVKGISPSMIMADELTDCDSREYFTYMVGQLNRRRNISGPQQYIGTCNPKGPSNWVYKVFWDECVNPDTGARDRNFSVYHVPFRENAHRPEMKNYLETLERAVKGDPVEKARLIDGRWVERPTGAALFRDYLVLSRHVVGDAKAGTGLVPVKGCPVVCGYDLGQVHNAIVLMQHVVTNSGPVWIVFDEIVSIGKKALYKNLAIEVCQKVLDWNEAVGEKLAWEHITDDSAVNQWKPGSGSYDAWEFEREFGIFAIKNGLQQMRMRGAPKGSGSIEARVRLVQAKLHQDQLLISDSCKHVKEALMMLEGRKDEPMKPHKTAAGHIHVFDALTYPMINAEIHGNVEPGPAVKGISMIGR